VPPNLKDPSISKSLTRLSLDESIDKVDALGRDRELEIRVVRDLHLFGQDSVPDFLSVVASVGPVAHHNLIGNDPDCKIVHCEAVVQVGDDLGGHVAWGA
jgi:hypothetical protein